MRVPLLLTLATAAIAASLCLPACKSKHRVPTVTQNTGAPVPTTQDFIKDNQNALVANLYELPPLGTGVLFTTSDGEVWNRYPCGILIHDVKPAEGIVPQLGQTVSIVYTGTFPGTKNIFDQNHPDNPLVFPLGSKTIIKGLSMGLSTMHAGGRRRMLIPPDLAYGEAGQRGRIPANQALIFEVDLISVTGDTVELPKPTIALDQPAGPELPTTAPTTKP